MSISLTFIGSRRRITDDVSLRCQHEPTPSYPISWSPSPSRGQRQSAGEESSRPPALPRLNAGTHWTVPRKPPGRPFTESPGGLTPRHSHYNHSHADHPGLLHCFGVGRTGVPPCLSGSDGGLPLVTQNGQGGGTVVAGGLMGYILAPVDRRHRPRALEEQLCMDDTPERRGTSGRAHTWSPSISNV